MLRNILSASEKPIFLMYRVSCSLVNFALYALRAALDASDGVSQIQVIFFCIFTFFGWLGWGEQAMLNFLEVYHIDIYTFPVLIVMRYRETKRESFYRFEPTYQSFDSETHLLFILVHGVEIN